MAERRAIFAAFRGIDKLSPRWGLVGGAVVGGASAFALGSSGRVAVA